MQGKWSKLRFNAPRVLLAVFGVAALSLLVIARGGHADTPMKNPTDRMTSTSELVSHAGKAINPDKSPGKPLFTTHCAICHNGTVPKAPAVVWLQQMSPDAILNAMRHGIMQQEASGLSAKQQLQVAEYLTSTDLSDYHPPAPPPQCDRAHMAFTGPPPADVGWGHDNRRFVPASIGGLTAKDLPSLKLKWAFAFPASVRARSNPAIGWNTIFVGSQDGTVYAFNIKTGCAKWTFRASAEVRTGIIADAKNKRLYFGDILGHVYAINAMTGKKIWSRKVDNHPNATITGTPTLMGDRLIVPVSSLEVTSAANPHYNCCTFRGMVTALDTATGKEIWRMYTIPHPPTEHGVTKAGAKILSPSGAPVWNSPTYDKVHNRIYFGTGENYSSPSDSNSDAVFAINAETGKRIWHTQLTKHDAWNVGCMVGNGNCPKEDGPDFDVAASPLLIHLHNGKYILVVGQKSGMVFGINPATGKIEWRKRLGHGGTQGGVHFGMAAQGTTVYVPIVDLANTHDGRVYNKAENGAGMHAINAANGKVLWTHMGAKDCHGRKYCDPGISAAATAIPGAVLDGSLDGVFRAYARKTGKILWSFNTTKPVTSITGTKAVGGSMSGPGAAVYDGYLVFNSGYGLYYHMPGNALYVFEKSDTK